MSFTSVTEPQPSLAWQFENSNVDYVSSLSPSYSTASGALTSLPTFVSGKYNQAIRLAQTAANSGANTYVLWSLAASPISIDTTGITIACWVNWTTLPGSFISMYDSFSNVLGIYMNSTQTYTGRGFSGTQALTNATSNTSTNSTGVWYHVALTYNSTSVILYKNGVGTAPVATGAPGVTITGLRIGSQANNINPTYVGYACADCTIDDLRVYNTALTAAQVQSVYSSQGAPAPGPVMPQPQYAWDFNGTTTPYIGSATGTTTGSVSYNSAGKYGQSLVIKNPTTGPTSANNINWITNSTFNMDAGFSVCFWLKVSTIPATDQSVIFFTNNSIIDYRYYISVGPSSTISFVFYNNSTFMGPTSYTLSTNTWLHVVAQTVGGSMQFYINGTLFSSSAYAPSGCTLNAGLWLGGIGNYGPTNAEYDDFRIFDRALTSIQVNDIYNQQGVPGRGALVSNSRQIYVAPTGTYPTYTPTSGAQFPVFNTSNVSFYSSGGTSGGTVGQYLNFGSQTFNMSMGFSAVCQFAFTNGIGPWERIFDFGNGAGNNNILLTRTSTSTNLLFSYRIGGTEYAVTAFGSISAQNTLYTVVAIYDPYKPLLSLYVNGTLTTSVPAEVARDTRTLTQTYVGRSNWGGDAYSNVNINYLSIYNCVLTSDEINSPLPTPQITLKGVPLFNQLSPSATSSAVGAFSLRAVNGVSTRAVAVQAHPVVQWPPVSMTSNTTVVSSQLYGNGTYIATASVPNNTIWYIFDNNISTYYEQATAFPYNISTGTYIGSNATTISSVSVSGEWFQVQVPTSIILRSYTLVGRQDNFWWANRNPTTFWIAGSNDGSNWSNVNQQTNITPPREGITINVPVTSNSVPYTYYRLVVNVIGNSNIGVNQRNLVNLSSWNLYGDSPSYAPNAAQDFYADERGNLLTAPVIGTSLQNWLGGATGYVTTWYDQSGRGNHMAQSTASLQPIISLATSPPSILFTGNGTTSGQYFQNTIPFTFNFGTNYQYSIRAVVNNTVGGVLVYKGKQGAPWNGNGEKAWYLGPSSLTSTSGNYPDLVGFAEGWVITSTPITSSKTSVTWASSSFSSVAVYENASSVTPSYTRASQLSDASNYLYFGITTASGVPYYNGNIYEIEIFSTPLSVSDVTIMG